MERYSCSSITRKCDCAGNLIKFENRFIPYISDLTTPKISKEESIAIANANYISLAPQRESKNIEESTTLNIFLMGAEPYEYRLAWKVPYRFNTFYIDAHKGTVLMKTSTVIGEDPGEASIQNISVEKESEEIFPTPEKGICGPTAILLISMLSLVVHYFRRD